MSGSDLVPAEGVPAEDVAPMLAGTFALYQTPDGGFMLVTEIPGRGVERRHVPGKTIRFLSGGVGQRLLGPLFGGG